MCCATVLYCTVLYCTVLYCTVLYCMCCATVLVCLCLCRRCKDQRPILRPEAIDILDRSKAPFVFASGTGFGCHWVTCTYDYFCTRCRYEDQQPILSPEAIDLLDRNTELDYLTHVVFR